MNYIVFDLEWNQCYGGQEFVNPRMPSEIIEIGAVKLDEKLNIIDRYESYVRPRLYRRLQPHIKAILNYDEKKSFEERAWFNSFPCKTGDPVENS